MKGKIKPAYSNVVQDTPGSCAGFIYCTTNILNGKKYIGSKTTASRQADRYLGSSKILTRAIDKYGIDKFERSILEIVYDVSNIPHAEVYWLNYFDCAKSDVFYNMSNNYWGGDTFTNNPNKECTRELQRLNAIRRNSASNITTPEIMAIHLDRMINNNPSKSRTTESLSLSNPRRIPINIEFKDGSTVDYISIKDAARKLNIKIPTMKWRYKHKLNIFFRGMKITECIKRDRL